MTGFTVTTLTDTGQTTQTIPASDDGTTSADGAVTIASPRVMWCWPLNAETIQMCRNLVCFRTCDRDDRRVLVPLAVDPSGFEGDFETHVTVRSYYADAERERLERWADEAGLKLTVIVLGRGAVPVQPMLTADGTGSLAERFAAAQDLVRRLAWAGFAATRVKIEASPWADGVPVADADARRLDQGCYFEHHVKLLMDAATHLHALAELVTPHGAHVSWNARRVLDTGRQERFVTQRCHGVGLATAGDRFEALCAALRRHGYSIVSMEREYVVYDSDASLDAGWIERNGVHGE